MIGGIVLILLGIFLWVGVTPDEEESLQHSRKAQFLVDLVGEQNYVRLGKVLAILMVLSGVASLVQSFF